MDYDTLKAFVRCASKYMYIGPNFHVNDYIDIKITSRVTSWQQEVIFFVWFFFLYFTINFGK